MIKRKQAITTEDPQRCYDYRHSGSARVCIVTTKSAFVIFSCFFIHCFTVLVCLRSYRFLLDRALPARRWFSFRSSSRPHKGVASRMRQGVACYFSVLIFEISISSNPSSVNT